MAAESYRTELEREPLLEILAQVAEYAVPATITCERDGRLIRIYTKEANLAFASPADPDAALGNALTARNLTTPQQYESATRRASESRREIGEELVADGLDEARLIGVAEEVSRAAIDEVLGWSTGALTMTPGRFVLPISLEIPLGRVILDAVRGWGDPKTVTAKVGMRTTVLKRTEREASFLSDMERSLLEQVDGKKALSELIAILPGSAVENVRTLYGFRILQLVTPRKNVTVKMKVNQ